MYSWSKDFPTLTELFFGKERDTESIIESVEDTNPIITEIESGVSDDSEN